MLFIDLCADIKTCLAKWFTSDMDFAPIERLIYKLCAQTERAPQYRPALMIDMRPDGADAVRGENATPSSQRLAISWGEALVIHRSLLVVVDGHAE
jgi:hypothetical protein